jgi:light-regulated signal transduction histidine kinase (bacteriophytochrome)
LLEQEVKNRTRELEELNVALQQSNEDLQQFAHVASHDLKEPVRKIRTFSNRLRDEYGNLLPEKGKTFLDKMQRATERIFSMIEGVLAYSTLNAAEQEIEKIDLNKTLANIEEDLEVSIQQKNARIVRSELPTVEGASILIHQLFYNLINNSLKFARTDELPVISITCSTFREGEQDYVEIAISDNGIGFEQEFAKRIFDTFTRLNAKDKFEGTGLGLALCKKIVERHHGSITATGIRNEGAVFTILLPLIQIQRPI